MSIKGIHVTVILFEHFHPANDPHPVSGEHLGSVFVLDLDDSGGLDPGLTVYLNGNTFIAQDGYLHCSTLIQAETRIRLTAFLSLCEIVSVQHTSYPMVAALSK